MPPSVIELLTGDKIKRLGDNEFDMPALWLEENVIKLMDQRLLPNKFEIFQARI